MEKRAYQRIPVSFEADILSMYGKSATLIGNLSPHGLHLITAHMEENKDFTYKTEIDLHFKTIAGEKLNLHCKKRWSYAITPNSLINRIGMEIIDPPKKYKEFLTTLNNPYKHGVNDDRRDLRIAVSERKYLDRLPGDGIGFYQWEKLDKDQIPDWPDNKPKKFRWTGIHASMSIEDHLKNSLTIFLLSSHPDIGKNPVEVEIIGDNRLIWRGTFTESKWEKVMLENYDLKDVNILTFHVNRTWSPKLSGFSGDERQLGVAVAILEQH